VRNPDPPLSASPLFDALASRHRVMITPGAMTGLTEFLNARLTEDELLIRRYWANEVVAGLGAPFDLARFLYDCVSKRMIVALHTPSSEADPAQPAVGLRKYICAHDRSPYPCLTLRALAIPYADHPEFREDWRS
jgi:Family of unknown function (DUF6221)